MPGHKGGRLGAFQEIMAQDITEIKGFDNLHQPQGIILEAQKRCAALFGAEESFFLVNGSTSGILSAILSVCSVTVFCICSKEMLPKKSVPSMVSGII